MTRTSDESNNDSPSGNHLTVETSPIASGSNYIFRKGLEAQRKRENIKKMKARLYIENIERVGFISRILLTQECSYMGFGLMRASASINPKPI